MENIKLIRLRHTPEEFLARVNLEDREVGEVHFEDPWVPVSNGQGQFALLPWTMWSQDRTFVLSLNDVLLIKDPLESIVRAYIERTSKIQIANTVPPTGQVGPRIVR
jgi:hypothetical protein